MAEAPSKRARPLGKAKPKREKLPRLPQSTTCDTPLLLPAHSPLTDSADARVEKRPLLRPAIPSPYSGASQQKIVYVSTHTPFLSAVKRVEKLLRLADKRLVQSATTNAKQQDGRGFKRRRGGEGDEIVGIAEEVERLKKKKRKRGGAGVGDGETDEAAAGGEEVVLKGTGKAIHRVLELALWFQQREEEYVVRLKTGSVGAIDDITLEEEAEDLGVEQDVTGDGEKSAEVGTEDAMDLDRSETTAAEKQQASVKAGSAMSGKKGKRKGAKEVLTADEVPETRFRYASVLEAAVSLR